MRIIAGEAGGVPLVAPSGATTRPTSDKLKGAIFSSLGDVGCTGRVLDLFAGSGGLGIEALSRGADYCALVDSAAAACRAIRMNLQKAKLADRAAVHQLPVGRFVSSGASEPYDLILMDPPYALAGLETLLGEIAVSELVGLGTTLLVEHASRRTLPPRLGKMESRRTRTHGDSAFTTFAVGPPRMTLST
ncbi:MAG TPA: RsmD family RNA methyltransferase [Chloroflexota bacterium]|nr:RsmD family RNA methyltransferase [Chloroflexota bacterium]